MARQIDTLSEHRLSSFLPVAENRPSVDSLPSVGHLQRDVSGSFPGEIDDEHMRKIIQQMPGIFWTTDLDFNITFFQGKGLARLSPAEHRFVVGMPLTEFFDDECVLSPVLDAHYVALAGRSQSFELKVAGVVFRGTVDPLFDADWDVIGTVGVAVEVTKRKQAETNGQSLRNRSHEIDVD